MAKFLTMQRHKSRMMFRTRSSSLSRRMMWLRWFGYLICVFAGLKIYCHLIAHPDSSFPRAWTPWYRSNVLRPGQYHEAVDLQFVPALSDEDINGPDEMGLIHDLRDPQFYMGGTLTLTSTQDPSIGHPVPSIYDPYPAYNSRKWRKHHPGRFRACLGPRGRDLDRTREEDMMLVYKGKQIGFPASRFGSYDAIGLDKDVCTDRYSRFGAYGYGDDGYDTVPGFSPPPSVNWFEVDWYNLQALCFERNADRYHPNSAMNQTRQQPLSFELREPPRKSYEPETGPRNPKPYQPRSAVLIRAWHSMLWTANHCEYLRALIMELALHSGAEYQVFLLIHVKDEELPIFSDAKTIQRLRKSIPAEFRNMALFFNDKLLEAWYPKIAEHSPILQHHQPLQVFSQLYPNFEYYWQLEMDARHTGHAYHFLDRSISFAKQQPRKYLWERNAYFYTPGAHGTWENFTKMVDERLSATAQADSTIWGPILGTGIRPLGPDPPVEHPANDNYTWGVGEEADLITYLPIFNPKDTQWTFPDKIWNFRYGLDTPRRTAVITMGRYSRRLLDLIHNAQATRGLGLASEMTGPSWALYHGLKAVHVPHPIYADGQWTPHELARIYNPGSPGNINGGPDSIWNWDHSHDHIMYRLSYMFTTHTAEDLYRRWLGYRTFENEGGKKSTETLFGRHCFPSMFLHTVKNTDQRFGPDRAVP